MKLGYTYLKLDRDWNMQKLAQLARLYTQCYSLVYSLSCYETDSADRQLIDLSQETYEKYFWYNGYGAGKFYDTLYANIPDGQRPQIKKIHYASPGYIMLMEVVVVATSLAIIVTAITESLDQVHDSYNRIHKGISERKLAKLEVALREQQLEREKREFIRESRALLSKQMGIPTEMQGELRKKCTYSDQNELKELRILMSFMRRVEPIAQMQSREELKIELPSDE